MRVLWLIKGLGPGGAEQLLVNHAGARDRDRFRYEAAYLVARKNHLVAQLEAAGVPVTLLDGRHEWDLRWAWRLRRRLRADPVDVVHGHSPYVAAITRLVLRTLPRRYRPAHVVTEHNRWPRHTRTTRLANLITFALDDAHVAVSDDVRATIPRRWRGRVEVLVHGVDRAGVAARGAERDGIRAELGLTPDDLVIGIVANFRAEKAYEVLLDAAALVTADPAGSRVVYLAVGQGPLEQDIRARHRALGLADRFRLLGYRDDATRVMAAFDIFTLSSRHEGLPVSLMDAMVLGTASVATGVGGIPEAVTDDVEGLLVPAGDAGALARAHLELATDDERRRRLGAAAAVRAEAFDIAVAVRRLEEIYDELAARRDASRS